MPQFDPANYSSQLFWFFVTFSLFVYISHFYICPNIRNIVSKREKLKSDQITYIENLKDDINKLNDYVQSTIKSQEDESINKIKEKKQSLIKCLSAIQQKENKNLQDITSELDSELTSYEYILEKLDDGDLSVNPFGNIKITPKLNSTLSKMSKMLEEK